MPRTSLAAEPQWSLLLAACSEGDSSEKLHRIRALLQSPIQWNVLLDLAERHGMQPLLYQALFNVKEAIDPGHFSALVQKYQTNLHKSLMLSRELIRVVDALGAVGIDVMPYKGLALAEAIYGDIALRQSGDIDLMVHAADLPRVREAVRELGYTPHAPLSEVEEREYLKSGYECAFDGTAGRNLLEVQWSIQPRFYAVDIDMEGLFRRGVIVSVAGRSMKTPSVEDLFIVLSLHAAKHVWGRMIWLCDLARIMRVQNLNWNWIGSQASELGIARILRVTLLLANRVLGAGIPAAAEDHLLEDRMAPMMAGEIGAYIFREEMFDVESLAYFRLMLRLREKRTDRARFLSRLALTPGRGEWAAVRLPGPMFPLYRMVRLARLAARFVR